MSRIEEVYVANSMSLRAETWRDSGRDIEHVVACAAEGGRGRQRGGGTQQPAGGMAWRTRRVSERPSRLPHDDDDAYGDDELVVTLDQHDSLRTQAMDRLELKKMAGGLLGLVTERSSSGGRCSDRNSPGP